MQIGKIAVVGLVSLSLLGGCSDGNSRYGKRSDNQKMADVSTSGASTKKRFGSKSGMDWQERALMAKRTYYFGFDKHSLSDEDKRALEAHAKYMSSNPEARLRVEGHTDERGSREYNVGLGERRAKAVYNYLLSLGVPESRMALVSYGKEKPADPRHEDEAWERNRRANIVYETS